MKVPACGLPPLSGTAPTQALDKQFPVWPGDPGLGPSYPVGKTRPREPGVLSLTLHVSWLGVGVGDEGP